MSVRPNDGGPLAEPEAWAGDFEEAPPLPPEAVSPAAQDAGLEEPADEALPLTPATALEDPHEATEAGRNPTRGED
ncbi:MAG: hypothetical protein VKQ33_01275 [Candidatus Sericytochromatia bacterium]|nr:hypothetical protein [Candidatus Sericytochromatia bacterium]